MAGRWVNVKEDPCQCQNPAQIQGTAGMRAPMVRRWSSSSKGQSGGALREHNPLSLTRTPNLSGELGHLCRLLERLTSTTHLQSGHMELLTVEQLVSKQQP